MCALIATGSVTRAAAAAGMSRESAYRLRARPRHADFARAWDRVVERKGHTSRAENDIRLGRAGALPPRESHEGHGSARTAQNGQLGQVGSGRRR
jgi:hypothetical protein